MRAIRSAVDHCHRDGHRALPATTPNQPRSDSTSPGAPSDEGTESSSQLRAAPEISASIAAFVSRERGSLRRSRGGGCLAGLVRSTAAAAAYLLGQVQRSPSSAAPWSDGVGQILKFAEALTFRSASRSSLRATAGKSKTESRPAATSAAYVAGRIRSSCTPIWPATTRKLREVSEDGTACRNACRSD